MQRSLDGVRAELDWVRVNVGSRSRIRPSVREKGHHGGYKGATPEEYKGSNSEAEYERLLYRRRELRDQEADLQRRAAQLRSQRARLR